MSSSPPSSRSARERAEQHERQREEEHEAIGGAARRHAGLAERVEEEEGEEVAEMAGHGDGDDRHGDDLHGDEDDDLGQSSATAKQHDGAALEGSARGGETAPRGRTKGQRGVSFTDETGETGAPDQSPNDRARLPASRGEYLSSSSSSRTADLAESGFSSSSSGFSYSQVKSIGGHGTQVRNELRIERDKQKRHHSTFLKHMEALKERGRNSSSYDDLLAQFGELSKELSRAIATSQRLADENDEMVSHYDRLKAEHLKLRAKYVDARKQAVEEAEARVALEEHHDDQLKRWRRQLELKAREFDELQVQLTPPSDAGLMHAKVRHELEAVHRAQLHAKDTELQKVRKSYFAEHNALELLKTEFDQYTENQRRELEALHAAHAAQCAELKAQLDETRRAHQESNKQDQVRLRSLDLEKTSAERDGLRAQLHAALREVEDLKVSLDQANVSSAAQLAAQNVQAKEAAVQIAGLRKKEQAVAAEARRLEDLLESANTKIVQHQSELGKMRTKLEATHKLVDEERARNSTLLVEQATKADRERHELRASADGLERKLTLLEQRHAEERKILDAKNNAALDEVTRSKERILDTLAEVQRSRDALQRELDEVKLRLESQTRESVESIDRLRAQHESQAAQLRRATKEKEALHDKAKVLADQQHDVRRRAEQYQLQATELEKEYKSLQEKHRETLTSEQNLRIKAERLEAQHAMLQTELAKLEAEKLELRNRCDQLAAEADDARSAAANKENTLQQRMAETLYSHTKEGNRAIEKLERKRTNYHDALEKCKQRIRQLQARLADQQQAAHLELQSHRLEQDVLQRRVKELEREREVHNRQIGQLRLAARSAEPTELGDEALEGLDDFVGAS